EALAETGRREDAQREWDKAARVAGQLGAVPLRSALDDLARRARLGHGPAPGWAGGRPGRLAGLTSREREVLRLIVAGRSNREIAVEVVEDLGHAAVGEPGGVGADLLVGARQQPPATVAGGLRARPDHAATDDPDGAGVAPGVLGGRTDDLDALLDAGQVGPA